MEIYMEGNKLLRLPEVESTTGLKKSAIYVRVKDGSFPEPVRLRAKAVAWRFDEIQQWINDLPRAIA
jgi:prophage regulatory protein